MLVAFWEEEEGGGVVSPAAKRFLLFGMLAIGGFA